jgi:Fe-S-cluster-containing hydrogenase component 2
MCVLACSLYHTGQCNPSLARLRVSKNADRYAFDNRFCLHCSDAACFAACPAEAMARDDQGIVSIIEEDCIACGACQEACPYDAIGFHQARSLYLKCDLCHGREGGPACVEVCPTSALSLMSKALESN